MGSVDQSQIDRVKELIKSYDITEDEEFIVEKLMSMAGFKVPPDDAVRAVVAQILKNHGVKPKSVAKSHKIKIEEINESGKWVELVVRVDKLWEPKSDVIGQTGLLEDETGKVKFTAFSKSNCKELEEDKCYYIKNCITDEYNGQLSVKFNKATFIEEMDIEVAPSKPVEVTGVIVSINKGSGLVKLCPECNKVLERSECKTHGRQKDAKQDLRINAVLDTGDDMFTVIADSKLTEMVIDTSMDQAKEILLETCDPESITEIIKDKLLGRYFKITGRQSMKWLIPEEITPMDCQADYLNAVLAKVEAF